MDNQQVNNRYLRTGWGFWPSIKAGGHELTPITHEQDIAESLKILFATLPGQRKAHPLFGCDLTQFMFRPVTATLITQMEHTIATAITRYEPRIDLHRVRVTQAPTASYQLNIYLAYTVRLYNARYDVTLPFYLMGAPN